MGKTLTLWHDDGHLSVFYLKFILQGLSNDSSLPLHAKVSCGEEWTWPAARSGSLVDIKVALCHIFQPFVLLMSMELSLLALAQALLLMLRIGS